VANSHTDGEKESATASCLGRCGNYARLFRVDRTFPIATSARISTRNYS